MKKNAGRYLLITLGCLISTCSINLFLVPHQLLSGGISGIAIANLCTNLSDELTIIIFGL